MALNIIEKGSNGLFENEIELNGRYATIIRHLKEDLGIFPTMREAYLAAAIIGFLNNRVGIENDSENVKAASIFASDLRPKMHDLRFIYRIIMLSKDEASFSIEDYMNRAFRDDTDGENSDKLKANMRIFNSYVCGGLDYLDERFGSLDRLDEIVDALYDFVHEFATDVDLIIDDELPDFEPTFR